VQPPLADELCGAFRPGHFSGVCTIVLKLFEMVRPGHAFFGKKDYQQLFLIKRMVEQFNLDIDIRAGETVRATDGLALSSRNGYLSAHERLEAPRLYAELKEIARSISVGSRDFAGLESAASQRLAESGWRIDYVSVRAQATLLPPTAIDRNLVILAAAWLNTTRLIDNLEVSIN
jgi:pantoate--beta-alanine ligase